VQTNYALSFTTEPPSTTYPLQSITPAPVVGVTESGVVATFASGAIVMTDSDSLLYGAGTTVNLSSGHATFAYLGISAATGSDSLTATLTLNPALSPVLKLAAQSSIFQAVAPTEATLTSPAPGSTLTGSNVTFTWTGGVGISDYELQIGTTGAGSANVYSSAASPATSLTVTVPVTGATLYVRLRQLLNGTWQSTDYTYIQFGGPVAASISSPAPGSTLTSGSVTFNWAGSNIAVEYQLMVGTTGPASSNVYNSGFTVATAETVTVPTTGATLYVRLRQLINGTWQAADYTYTEYGAPTPAAITSPAPGSTLTSGSVTFNWAGSNAADDYQLLVGTTGVASSNVYNSGLTSATSATVSVPTTGATLYVRLRQRISNVWQAADYTYTEK